MEFGRYGGVGGVDLCILCLSFNSIKTRVCFKQFRFVMCDTNWRWKQNVHKIKIVSNELYYIGIYFASFIHGLDWIKDALSWIPWVKHHLATGHIESIVNIAVTTTISIAQSIRLATYCNIRSFFLAKNRKNTDEKALN